MRIVSGRFSRLMLVLVMVGMMAAPAARSSAQDATPEGVDGDTYTSPTYGYSLNWDSDLWEAGEVISEDGYDSLELLSEGANLYVEGVYFYQGDPDECLAGERLRVADDAGYDDIEQLTDDNGDPVGNSVDGDAWALFDQPESTDGSLLASIVFIECVTLVPNSVVLINTAFIDPENLDQWEPAVYDVLDTLNIPVIAPNEIDEAGAEQLIRSAVADINDTWSAIFSDMGLDYVDPKIITVTGPTETDCGDAMPGETGPFYCPSDQTIYVDMPEAIDSDVSYGEVFVEVIIAHEIGHHVQELLQLTGCTQSTCGEPESSIAIELQADCFAGVWMKDAGNRGVIDERELSRVEIAIKTFLGDPIDVPSDDPDAHGTGDQRFELFMDGYEEGVTACGL